MMRYVAVFFAWSVTILSGLLTTWLYIASGTITANDLSGVFFVVGAVAVGSLIIWHMPQNRIGWLFGGVGLLWAVSNAMLIYTNYIIVNAKGMDAFVPWFALAGSWLSDLAWITSVTFLFLLFPDGRLPSPRWHTVAWIIGGVLFTGLVLNLIAPGPLSQMPTVNNPVGITSLDWLVDLSSQFEFLFVGCIVACLISIFARYYAAGPLVRRQIKWVAYLGLLLALLYLSSEITRGILGESSQLLRVFDITGALMFSTFPLVIGIAVLRYRLFDIDFIIRKTLVYAVLSGLLGLVYFGMVASLQRFFEAVSGQQSPVVIVISTLAIAALFAPLRQRVQAFIDRRFYRKKYDAQQVLAQFAQTARDEVSLEALQASLTQVVRETMHPEFIRVMLVDRMRSKDRDSD